MSKLKIAIQCNELGARGGVGTYGERLCESLNKCKDVECKQFVNKLRKNSIDVILINYEPGLMNDPRQLQYLTQKYAQPIVVIVHHIGYLPQFFGMVDGYIFHSESQYEDLPEEPWPSFTVIPHPALVYPEKGKEKMRKKYGLPLDKKIIGTAGFIAGTGKDLDKMVRLMLNKLNDDEYLYFITSFWKAGDLGVEEKILEAVEKSGKKDNFRIDTDFVSEEVLNEKMQCCDLLFTWNNMQGKGSSSGIASDMVGTRRKLIAKDSGHYDFVRSIKGVETGRAPIEEFVEDVFKLAREGDLSKVANPDKYSWDYLVKEKYLPYLKEVLGE